MIRFEELWRPREPERLAVYRQDAKAHNQWAADEFPRLVGASPLRLLDLSDPLPDAGEWWLLGVATYSGYEMRLLDLICDRLGSAGVEYTPLCVVDLLNGISSEGLRQAGLEPVVCTPVAALRVNGAWAEIQVAGRALNRMAQVYDVDLDLAKRTT